MKKLLYSLAFSWISYASIAQTPSACFSSRNDISFMNNHVSTRGITKGDFDNDGKLDVVTTNFVTGGTLFRFSFQKGLGNGKFGSPIPNCVSGNSTLDIRSTDFNNDGNLDLAFANNNGVYIYHGQGNGVFDSITRLTLAASKYLVIGDFNEDGAQDIAVATGTTSQFTLFKGTVGNPTTFTSQVFSITGFISNMEVADMNGDGHLDIVHTTTTGVYVSLNNAASLGNFLTSSLISIGGNSPTDLTLCDIDGDGDIDVVTTNKTGNNISTAFNNGSGTVTYGASYATETGPEGIDNADVNLDGKKDIIVANNTSSTVSIFFGGAGGVFTLNQTTQAPGNAKVIITGFFNADTYPDIVSGQSNSKYINSFLGNAAANYMQVDLVDVTNGPNSAFSGDFNGDGNQDLALLLSTGGVQLYSGNGSGVFTPGSILATGTSPTYITGADLNNNGKIDLVVVNNGSGDISVYYGTGTGAFSAPNTYSVGTSPVQAKIGNLNGDSFLDIVVTNSGSSNFSVLLAASATSFNSSVNYTTASTPYAVVITDYNLDNNNDIVIGCNTSSSTYAKFLNSGTGTFSANGSIGGATTSGAFITQLESADLDGDGDFDIIVGKSNDVSRIFNPAVTSGNAGSNLVSIANTAAGSGSGTVTGLKIIDINNDGHLDVIGNFNSGASTVGNLFASVATAYGTNTAYILTPPSINFASELEALGMAYGDYNNDGRTDVIIPNKSSNSFTIHWNTTPVITAGGPTTFCNGNSVTLTSTAASNWYSWTPTSETTQAINATATGTYYVTTSSSWSEWCSSSSNSISVTATPGPTAPTITNSGSNTVCEGNTVTLTSSQSTGNQWYKDGFAISGATNQTYVASSAGIYTVTYTNAGCTSPESNAIVLVFSQTPVITAMGPTTFCAGGSVVLHSNVATNLTWTPGGATTQDITATTAGTYSVTNAVAGCPSLTSNSIVVTVGSALSTPSISPAGPLTICSGNTVTLTSSSSTDNVWSTGATTQSIVVSTSGNYFVHLDNGSCTSANSNTVSVTVNPTPSTPTISAGGPTTFCSGNSVVLTSSASSGNSWTPGGATTQSITVSTSGSYTVTVTSGGCSATSAPTAVTVNSTPATPTITASGPTTFCSGGSVTLTAPTSSSYLWSTGATTQSIVVTTSGSYSVQVTNASGCQSAPSAATSVTVNPIPATPTVSASGPTTFCSGGSVNLTSSATSGNIWSSGPSTQTITVTTSGTYTVTQTISGCTSAASSPIIVTVNSLPSTPTITASGPTTFCSGGSVTLTAPTSTSYLWSTGATTQSIVVSTSGSYTVQVTNASGCQSAASAATTVTVNPIPATPTVSAGGPTTFCTGGSVVLTSSATSGNTWSSGATTQSITVTTSGSYTVTQTVSGCTSASSSPVTVTVNTLPATPTITASGPTTFCAGGSVTLTAPTSTSYLWSTGATTQSIVVSTSGSFTVQVSNASGCQSAVSAATSVTVNPIPATPTISNSGPLTFCLGSSVTLTSSGGPNYQWSAPSNATTQSINATASGSYTVQVIDANGCISAPSAPKNVTVNALPSTPTISAGGATTFCAGGSVVLTSTSQTNYLWSPGSETTQSITVTTSGTYSVQAVNGSGCQSVPSNTITVTVNPIPATPIVTVSGPTTFCDGGSVTLTAPVGYTYLWSNGATTQSIVVTTSGSYSVQVTDGNGCSSLSSAAVSVTVNPIPAIPVVTASGPTTFCAGGSVVLTSSASSGNLWSNGATTQSITVSTSGNYTVTETQLGCTSGTSTSISVLVNPLPATPSITASGPTTFCSGGSVVLTAPSGFNYLWSNSSTTESITVTTTGSYSVQVIDVNGCSSLASSAVDVTVNPIPATPIITASGPTTFCAGGSVILTSSASSGNTWSPGSATTQSITVNTSGTFTVIETQLGCSSAASAPVTVTVNPLPATPTITASGPTTFCIGNSVVLTAPVGFSYLWSNGATTQSITVTTTGTYTVQVIDGNGCSSLPSSAVNVTVNPLPTTPTIAVSGPTTFCDGGSVTLTAPSGFAYLWSTGATIQSIVVNSTTSNITVQITNANGCTSLVSAPVNVTVNPLPAAPTISAGGPTTFCAGGSVSLTSTSGSSYIWSPSGSTQTIVASSAGAYSASITDANGCLSPSSNIINVTVNPLPATPTVTASGPTTFCDGGSVILSAPSGYSYLWSNGETTQSITVTASGSYTVQVTDGNGCTSLASAVTSVTVNPIPAIPVVTASGPTTFCAGGSVVLTSSASSGNLWSNGATTQSITVSTSGNYTVTETQLGCTSGTSTSISVLVNPLPATPSITASGPTTFCSGGSVDLSAPTGYTYLWSNGATTETITVSTSGSFTVQVTDGNSCTSLPSTATTVTVNSLPATPSITVGGATTFCAGGSVTLTAPAGFTYLWSNGATTQSIVATTTGSYTVQVTDGNSCTSLASAPVTVTVNPLPAAPVVTASGPTSFCTGGSVDLTSTSGATYFWSNSAVTQNITVNTSGNYSAQITDANGCLSPSSNVISVTVNALPATPTITASGATTFCAGGSVTLIAPSGYTAYNWSNGATTQSIVVSSSGSYTVQVTNTNGCQSFASTSTTVTVNPIPPTPVITASGATTFCAGNSITLTSSASSGNLWSPGGQTTQSITVSTSGTYTVTETQLGCTSPSSSPVTITVNPIPSAPTITANGPTTFCTGGSVDLTSSVTTGNIWSTTETTQTITASISGNYTVTQTVLGCTSAPSNSINVVVNPYPAVPTITASGPTTFCAGGSVTLTSSSATNNLWSSGPTTQSITVTNSGTYVVQVITNGCASGTSAPVTVTVNALPPAPSIVNGPSVAICQGSSVTLTSSSTAGNIWTPGGQTTPSISVSTAGTYTVAVIDGNGCQSPQSSPTTVTLNSLPAAPVISANGPTTFCIGGDVTLTSSYSFNNVWSTSSTANSITLSSNNTVTVHHTDANGCVSPESAPVQVIVNPTPPAPIITASGPTTFCAGGSVTLTSNQTSGNSWSTGAMTQSINVTTTSVISVIYIDGNGCASSSSSPVSVSVLANPPAPSISASGPTTFCQGGSVTLTSSNTSGNTWSNGPITQSINVNASGTYTVTFTNANGCSTTSAPTTVNVTPISNIPSITANGPTTFCDGGSVILTSSDPVSTWNTGASTQSITVTTSGSYAVAGNQTGCPSGFSAPIVVTVNPAPSVPTITPSGPTTLCADEELYLFSSSSGTNTWSTGTIGPVIQATTSGNYFVTASNSFGCTSQSSIIAVVINPLPVVTVDPMNPLCIITAPFVLSNGQPAGGSYSGSGITGNIFYPAQVGVGATLETYTYTDNNGCTATANGVIQVEDCAGIEENEKYFALYPNPTNGNFQIVSTNAPIDRIVIYDAQGKMIRYQEYSGENQIGFDLTDFATGVYYIEIKSDSYIERTPLIINH